MSHLAKYDGRGLNFGGGAGISTAAIGVIISLTYVQLFKLQILAPGTLNSSIELQATRLLPLMTKDNFECWYQ